MLSEPTRIVALRMTEQERDALMRLAHDQHVTMTWLICEGFWFFVEDVDVDLFCVFVEGDSCC